MIPEGWELRKLQDCGIAVIDGDRGKAYPSSDDFFDEGYCLFLSAKNVTKVGFIFDDCQFVTEAKHKELRKGSVQPGDLVLTTRGTVGNVGYLRDLNGFGAIRINSGMVVVRNSQKLIETDFLHALFRSPVIEKQIERLNFGSAQPQLTVKIINSLKLPIPPKGERQRITGALETWTRAIETVEALIANARAQKQALMQQLLNGKHRLPGFSGEWQRKPINEIATRVTRRNDGSELPVLTISSTSGFVRQDEKYSRYMAGKSVETYIMLNEGEFAYNKGNSKTYEFGCIFDLEGYERALVPHVYVCFKLKKGYSHRFYKALFEADYLAPQLGRLVNTGVRNNGLLNIKPSEFLGTRVPVPPLDEQDAIAAVMEAASRTVLEHETQLAALRQEKAALMQQLLTGKRRVKLPESEVV